MKKLDNGLDSLSSKNKTKIRGLIRQAFKYSDLHREVKRRARVEKKEGHFKNGKEKIRVYYECYLCKGLFKDKDIEVEHVEPIGKFRGCWNEFISKLFCSIDNLDVACKECHKKKTKRERNAGKATSPKKKRKI